MLGEDLAIDASMVFSSVTKKVMPSCRCRELASGVGSLSVKLEWRDLRPGVVDGGCMAGCG